MKKIVKVIIICIIFISSIIIGKLNYKKMFSNTLVDISNENIRKIEKNSNIIEKKEFFSTALFEPTYDDSNESTYLYKDMIFDNDSDFYYKVILSIEDYDIYKTKIPLMEMNEKDFEDKFIIILSNENNNREYYEKDLIIYDVLSEEMTTKIIVKQRENPSYYSENNVLVAVVDKSILNDEIDIKIDN